jgi:hypothetical protein
MYARTDSDGVKAFLFKVLKAPPGIYYVEFPVGKISMFVPLKYYRYPSRNKRVGGDTGMFHIPQFVVSALEEWGIEPGYIYVRVWGIA